MPLAYLVACEKTGPGRARALVKAAPAQRGETGREIARDRGAGGVGTMEECCEGTSLMGRGAEERESVGVD